MLQSGNCLFWQSTGEYQAGEEVILPSSVMNSVTVPEKFDSSELLSFKSGFLYKIHWKPFYCLKR